MRTLERPGRPKPEAEADGPELAISPEKVCFVIMKAREIDAKDEVTDFGDASNPTDDGQRAVLEDHRSDPSFRELTAFVDALNEDEQVDLVALAWLGRGDYTAEDWASVRQDAAAAHNTRTAQYLRGTPLLADYLQAGLDLLGHSCEEFETGRL